MSLIKSATSITVDEKNRELTSSKLRDIDICSLTDQEIEEQLDAIEESDTFALFIKALYNDRNNPKRLMSFEEVFGDDFEELSKGVSLHDEE